MLGAPPRPLNTIMDNYRAYPLLGAAGMTGLDRVYWVVGGEREVSWASALLWEHPFVACGIFVCTDGEHTRGE